MHRPLAAAALAGALLAPTDALATSPCDPNTPCHNNPAEFPILAAFAADGYAWAVLATSGNSATLARGSKPGVGWLGVGYFAAVYNFALGATWTGLGGDALLRFPDDGYARMQVGIGAAHLAFGALTLGVTAGAHAQGRSTRRGSNPVFAPTFAPTAGGAALGVAGAF